MSRPVKSQLHLPPTGCAQFFVKRFNRPRDTNGNTRDRISVYFLEKPMPENSDDAPELKLCAFEIGVSRLRSEQAVASHHIAELSNKHTLNLDARFEAITLLP